MLLLKLNNMDKVDNMERDNKWLEAIMFLKEKITSESKNIDNYLRVIFICWYVLLETELDEDSNEAKSIQKSLNYYTNQARLTFQDDNRLNFFLGWMINISFWYFDFIMDSEADADNIGKEMMYKAYKSNPENLLYKWANRQKLNLQSDEIDRLRLKFKENPSKYLNLGYTINGYFEEMVGYQLNKN